MQRIFLSSVQREFADERAGIRDFIHGDALLRRFFEMADGFVVRVFRPERLQSSKPMASGSGTKLALSRHQVLILRKCLQASPLTDLLGITERSDRTKFRNQVLKPMLTSGLVKMTLPGKPTSSNQKYLTTELGEQALAQWSEPGARE